MPACLTGWDKKEIKRLLLKRSSFIERASLTPGAPPTVCDCLSTRVLLNWAWPEKIRIKLRYNAMKRADPMPLSHTSPMTNPQ